ncbi:DEAD/DEAH box helicase [Mesorhizobium sp. M1143]|uniref:DEAD/DEAH box helicase n=1 Tax=Mesorhizobium sp. M1143 TaxID=2957061 RepID=UPI00333CD9AF
MRQWVLDNGFLKIAESSGIADVTADEIYRAVIENDAPWPDLQAGKSGAAAALTFSRYPASLSIVMNGPLEGVLPHLTYELRTQGGHTFMVSAEAVLHGHVIVEDTWYPLLPENIEELSGLLGSVRPGQNPKSLREVLGLREAALRSGPVIDRMSTGALDAVALAGKAGPAPDGIRANLYNYQAGGWRWLRFIMRERLGGLLADEMGLGKTLQIISAVRDPGTGSALQDVLVVAPGSLLENWKRELAKFAPDLAVLKHHGSLRTGRPAELSGYNVVITSYDTVIRDLSLLKSIAWSVMIADEAQNIKNPDALRTRCLKEIPRAVGLAMTGTPVENRLTDLWSIMDFAVPGYLGDIGSFRKAYDDTPEGAAILEPVISPLMLRRRVVDVATDLPERIDIPEAIELTESEASEYERIRAEIVEKYGAAATLVSLTSLRQYCAHPSLLDSEEDLATVEFSKFQRLLEILTEISASGEKAIVFTSYNGMADRIAHSVRDQLRVEAYTLDGRLEIDARQPLIDHFSRMEGAAVLVLNPKAGGSGLNITAANHVIHYNLEWNPALEDQASARAHRRGQTRPVTVRRMFCAGTVEDVVNARVERKRQISSSAIVGVRGAENDYADILAALQSSPLRGKLTA